MWTLLALADQAQDIFEQLFVEYFGKKHLASHTLRCSTFVKALMHHHDLAKTLACADRSRPYLAFGPCTFSIASFTFSASRFPAVCLSWQN